MTSLSRSLIVSSFVLLLLNASSLLFAQSTDWDEIPMTRWISPDREQPGTYQDYINRFGQNRPFEAERVVSFERGAPLSDRIMVVLVYLGYYIFLQNEVNDYINDIAKEGFAAEVYTLTGGTPEDVRNLLIQEYYEKYGSAFAGVLLIDDTTNIPVPWFDLGGDHFPSDLYYMDMDGDWYDSNGDGLFELHEDGQGDTAPEIFLGRLTATTFNGSAIYVLEDYFDKVHTYRTGGFNVPHKALGFCDDDWSHWGLYGLQYSFDDVTIIDEHDDTNAGHYKSKLAEGYHFIHTMAHSYPGGHHFSDSSGGGWVFNNEVNNIDPWALFYNLFACSNCRYTEKNYMGGVYIFCQTHGLCAVGSTKSGSMLSFEHYYEPIHRNVAIGDAYCNWWESRYPYSSGDISWFYGMTLLGDPTLVMRPGFYNETVTGEEGFAHYPPFVESSPALGADYGSTMASGDLNNDGHCDLVVGIPGAAAGGLYAAGKVEVIYGPHYTLRDQVTAQVPAAGESFGFSLSIGDLNSDGFMDIAVGIPGRDVGGFVDAGAVRVLYGPSFSYGPEKLHSYPGAQVRFGTSLVLSDLTHDNKPELAVGGPGEREGGIVEVFKGPGLTPLIYYQPKIYGVSGAFGSVVTSGDLNGDQVNDLIISAPKAQNHGDLIAFLGPSLTFPKDPMGFVPSFLSRTGSAMVVADFDNDGNDDVAVGAPGADAGGLYGAGEVFLFQGPILDLWKTLTAPVPETHAEFGWSLAAADFNGDGFLDLCAGAPLADEGEIHDAGQAYILFGPDFTTHRTLSDSLPERNTGFGTALVAGPFVSGTEGVAVASPRATADPSGSPVILAGDVHLFGFALQCDRETIPASTGGAATFDLYAGPGYSGRTYLTALSASGTYPGVALGDVKIPLNFDAITNLGFLFMNTPFFDQFGGTLNSEGRGQSIFNLPGGLSGVQGLTLYFAFFTLNPFDFASNPLMVEIE